jgi:hypothetical protein
MLNPPFYSDDLEAQGIKNTRNPDKRTVAKSINTASYTESIFEDGGEVGFLKKIIDESIGLGEKIK